MNILDNAKEYVKIIKTNPDFISKDMILLEQGEPEEIFHYFLSLSIKTRKC